MVRMEPCLESLLPDFSSYSPVQSGRPAGYCVPETHGYHTGFSGQDLGTGVPSLAGDKQAGAYALRQKWATFHLEFLLVCPLTVSQGQLTPSPRWRQGG